MKMEYKITEKFTPESIEEILRIEREKGLTPENIVIEAKKKTSPLHKFFEWDDSLAGEKWRLAQARILVNEVKVIIEDKEYYAFENIQVAVYNDGKQESEGYQEKVQRVYKPLVEIMSNQEMKEQIIRASLRQLSYWEEQNKKYDELSPIIKSATRVRKNLEKKWQKKKQ